MSVNEETTDRRHNPGRAAIFATLALLAIYLLTSVAAQAYGGVGATGLGLANPIGAMDVLANLGQSVLGGSLNKLLILATLSSAIGALQTGILPTARTTLAMSTYRALPEAFGRMSQKYKSPSVSTFFIGGSTAGIFLLLNAVDKGSIMSDSILCIGLLISFYYGLVGFTCAWHFRRELRNTTNDLILKGVIPMFGAITLALAFVYSAIQMWKPDYGFTSFHGVGGVFLFGIGTLVLGVLVMFAYSIARPDFFRHDYDFAHAPDEEVKTVLVSKSDQHD